MSEVPLPGLVSDQQLSHYNSSKMPEKLPSGKNPFINRGEWTPEYLDQLDISIVDLRETTSNFTRSKQPGHRYWRGNVVFKFEKFESRILKMSQCSVPYNKNASYGKDFIYANLQKPVADAIIKACMKENIVATHLDRKLSGSDNDWWAVINNTDGNLGTIDETGDFETKDMQHVFDVTERGARMNLDLVFAVKLTLENGKDRKPNDVFRISADCSRGAIKAFNVDIDPPNIDTQVPQQRASRDDVVGQDLIDAINKLTARS